MSHCTSSHVLPSSVLRLTPRTFGPTCHRGTIVERRPKIIAWAMPKPFLEGHTVVEALDDTRDIIFYTHTLCPYAQRVWLTLLEKVIVQLALPAQILPPQVQSWSLRSLRLLHHRELTFNQSKLTLRTSQVSTDPSPAWCLLLSTREASSPRA